jgi:hypothetical protein
VVRVTDNPTQVPDRPTPGDGVPDTGVTIETKHTAGKPARITLDADGNVVITGSSITLDTQGNGDIELKANNIKVQLGSGGTMDVS